MSMLVTTATRTRLRLLVSSALVGVAALANSHALSQTLPDIANAGGATPTFAGNDLTIDLNDASRVIDYNSFNIGTDNSVNFTSTDMVSPFSVLNRVIMANPSSILGDINSQSNIAVWLVNPSGITFGDGATFSGGALVLSTADIGNADFLDGSSYTLTQGAIATANPSDSTIVLASGSTIGAPNGFVAIAQDIRAGAAITSTSGNVALVAAADTILDFTPGSPITVNVTKGTTIGTAQVNVIASGAISARSITIAGGSANAAVTNLLSIDSGATLTATAADGRVTIANATDALGGVTVAPGQTFASDLRIDGSITANGVGGDIGLTSSRAIATSGTLTADDQVAIGASSSITIGGAVLASAAGGDIGIVSDAGSVATTAMLTAGDAVSVVGALNVNLAAFTATAGTGDVRSNLGNVTVSSATTGGNLTIEARAGVATVSGMISSGANYNVAADAIVLGGAAASTQTAANTISLLAEVGDVSLGGPATLTLTSNSDSLAPDGVTMITAAGDGDIALAGSVLNSSSAGGTSSGVFLNATANDITVGTINADLVSATGAATITSGAINAKAGVTLTASGAIGLSDVVASADPASITINAGGTLTASTIRAGSNVDLRGTNVAITSVEGTGGRVDIASNPGAGAGVTVGGVTAGTDIAIDAANGAAVITGNVAAGGNYAVTADSLTIGSAGFADQRAGNNITFTTTGANGTVTGPGVLILTSNSDLAGGGATMITAAGDGDIALGGAVLNSSSAGGTSSGVFLNATGDDITVGTINADLVSATGAATITSGAINAKAGVTLTASGAIGLTDVVASADPASITINAGGNLTASTIRAGSNVDLRGANVAITSVEGTGGRVDIASNPGTGAGVTIDRVTAGTDIAIDSADGAAIITGTVAAGGNYAVTGASIALGNAGFADQRAGGGVTLTATAPGGMVSGIGGLVLTANSDLTGGGVTNISTNNGAISFGAATSLVSSGEGQSSGIVFNSGTADLNFGSATAETLLNLGTPANIISTGNILTRLSLSLATTGNLVLNTVETTGPASTITLSGGNVLDAESLRAVAGLTASADVVSLRSVVASQGAIDIDADVGDLFLGSGQSFTGATITKTGPTGSLVIGSLLAGIPAGAASSDIDIDSSTDAQIGTASAFAGNINVDAVTDIRGVGASPRANLSAAADNTSPTLSGADRDVTVRAGGQVLLGSVTAGRNVSVTAANIDLTSTSANSGDLVLFAQNGQLTLGEGASGGVAVLIKSGAVGDLRITDSLLAGQEAGSNGTVVLQSETDVLLAQYDAGGGSGFVGSGTGDVVVMAGGSVAGIVASALPADRGFGAIGAAGDLSITSSDDIRAASLSAGGSLTVDTAGSLTANGLNSTGTLVPGGALLAQAPTRVVSITSGNAPGNKVQLDTIAAGAGVTITSPAFAVGTIRTAGGTVTLNEAPGTPGDQSNFYVGSLESSGSLALTLSGTPDAAGATSAGFEIVPGFGAIDLTAGSGAISVTAAQVAQVDRSVSATATAITANAVSLVDASAGGTLQLTASGADSISAPQPRAGRRRSITRAMPQSRTMNFASSPD